MNTIIEKFRNRPIHIFCDTPDSFMHEYLQGFVEGLKAKGISVFLFWSCENMPEGDVAFFVSCRSILTKEQLGRHAANVIVHPSKLPEGRGSGVVSWKILEGQKEIWVTLFEPTEKLDSGDIFYQISFSLSGYELCDEIRAKQADISFQLIIQFLRDYPNVPRRPQVGKSTFYQRRRPHDSELDINRSIKDQFRLLQTVDNKRYPAFFELDGHKYIVKIYRDEHL